MSNLATISLNLKNGDTEIIGYNANKEILSDCIRSAAEGRTIYSISETLCGYKIRRRKPDTIRHEYVSSYRNGEYTWYRDCLYAKHYSKETALRHVRALYGRDKA